MDCAAPARATGVPAESAAPVSGNTVGVFEHVTGGPAEHPFAEPRSAIRSHPQKIGTCCLGQAQQFRAGTFTIDVARLAGDAQRV